MFRKIGPIFLVIVWIIVIFNFSSQNGSVSQSMSQSVTNYISNNYNGALSGIDENMLHYLVRKAAHIALYFVLSIVVCNALYFAGFRGKGLFTKAFLICFFYASMDEINQKFINNRSGRLTDVFIDGVGIVLGIILVFGIGKVYIHMKGTKIEGE